MPISSLYSGTASCLPQLPLAAPSVLPVRHRDLLQEALRTGNVPRAKASSSVTNDPNSTRLRTHPHLSRVYFLKVSRPVLVRMFHSKEKRAGAPARLWSSSCRRARVRMGHLHLALSGSLSSRFSHCSTSCLSTETSSCRSSTSANMSFTGSYPDNPQGDLVIGHHAPNALQRCCMDAVTAA